MAGMQDAFTRMAPLFGKEGAGDLKAVKGHILSMRDEAKASLHEIWESGKKDDGYLHGMIAAYDGALTAINTVLDEVTKEQPR